MCNLAMLQQDICCSFTTYTIYCALSIWAHVPAFLSGVVVWLII
jgi:hypothetical protein